jgi:hypothetical protein
LTKEEKPMPRKLSDRAKKEAGTYRPTREGTPKTVPDAQAALALATGKLSDARKRLPALKGRANAKARKHCEDRIRVFTDDVEIATEDLFKAMKAAEQRAAAPDIRPGLELMSYRDCMNANPPLSDNEELHWLVVGPAGTSDLARRKQSAGLPLTADEQSWLDGLTK